MRRLFWILLLGGLGLAGLFVVYSDGLLRRDLACGQLSAGRGQEICRLVARNMDWTWTGHAIVSPSFRVGFAGARRTFCQAPITPEDTGDLIGIVLANYTRSGMVASQLNNGARALLYLLGEKALAGRC